MQQKFSDVEYHCCVLTVP